MSLLTNATGSGAAAASKAKVDCAKECPCGVPVIPVPDQWLEVMVTGGFKVWHIIFIIIAFVIALIVIYCCFHRCRIPRTKQEIEADLMRTNITNKFRDYMNEFPNEPTTFIEALKRVQEIEEKSEKEDAFAREASARKRRGWLKLKGPKEEAAAAADKEALAAEDKSAAVEAPVEAPPPVVEAAKQVVPKAEEEGPPKEDSIRRATRRSAGGKRASKDATSGAQEAAANPSSSAAALETPRADAEHKTGQQQRQVRRRRHKPNLSRTRRTGEADLEKGAACEEAPTPELSGCIAAPSGAGGKQHVQHRVRIEPNV